MAKRIFVSGPITSEVPEQVFRNIGAGIKLSSDLVTAGFTPYCPFLDFMYSFFSAEIHVKRYYDMCMDFLEVMDGILMMPGWEKSKGAIGELARAAELQLPVFYSKEELFEYDWGIESK